MAKGRERQVKFYFKNEAEVMRELGLVPTKGSGSSWVEKEDGQNDFVIAQLKSTDKSSYSLKQLDMEKLEYNASVARKIPMFVVQFLNKDARYALMAIEDIPMIAEYITTGKIEKLPEGPLVNLEDVSKDHKKKPKIKSSGNAREKYLKEQEKMWNDKKYNK